MWLLLQTLYLIFIGKRLITDEAVWEGYCRGVPVYRFGDALLDQPTLAPVVVDLVDVLLQFEDGGGPELTEQALNIAVRLL